MKREKVFVGLSGGVDSALTACLLKEQGYDITGVFIKVWHPDFLPCNWREERRDAMRVAVKLDIPFLFFDFEKEYKSEVADYMINEYKEGRTPNPDVLCNRIIKFGSFWNKAKSLGADYIATGHYARIKKDGGQSSLLEGKDKEKDQSYFLWMLEEEELEHILLPIGEFKKNEVRDMAKNRNLPVATKKDSQGICFMGDISLEEFLSHFIEVVPGYVLNIHGETIGHHNGAIFYTIGERRGFDITKKTPNEKPFYVISKSVEDNTITVSSDMDVIKGSNPEIVKVTRINWINKPSSTKVLARIRYRQEKIPVEIFSSDDPKSKEIPIKFLTPQTGVSFGQSIVFYDGERCLGGGIMNNNLS